MKTLTTLILVFITFTVFGQEKQNSTAKNTETLKKLELFLKNYEKDVLKHNTEKVLLLMDKEYLSEQHDNNLRGNTKQFLDEFFCGNLTNKEGFVCIKFINVTQMERLKIIEKENSFIVKYRIVSKQNEIETEWDVSMQTIEGKIIFGLIGAVG